MNMAEEAERDTRDDTLNHALSWLERHGAIVSYGDGLTVTSRRITIEVPSRSYEAASVTVPRGMKNGETPAEWFLAAVAKAEHAYEVASGR